MGARERSQEREEYLKQKYARICRVFCAKEGKEIDAEPAPGQSGPDGPHSFICTDGIVREFWQFFDEFSFVSANLTGEYYVTELMWRGTITEDGTDLLSASLNERDSKLAWLFATLQP